MNAMSTPVAYVKILEQGIPIPSKSHPSDVGFDISIIGVEKTYGTVTLYRTGLAVQPPEGMFFEVVPRSSISKTGYVFANSVGIIDPDYTGEILIALRKLDKDGPDLELPVRIAQLIPRSCCEVQFQEVASLQETVRGSGGFGSTGNDMNRSEISHIDVQPEIDSSDYPKFKRWILDYIHERFKECTDKSNVAFRVGNYFVSADKSGGTIKACIRHESVEGNETFSEHFTLPLL